VSGRLPGRQDQGPGWATIWLLYWYSEFISAQGAGPCRPTRTSAGSAVTRSGRSSLQGVRGRKVKCPKCGSGNVAQVLRRSSQKHRGNRSPFPNPVRRGSVYPDHPQVGNPGPWEIDPQFIFRQGGSRSGVAGGAVHAGADGKATLPSRIPDLPGSRGLLPRRPADVSTAGPPGRYRPPPRWRKSRPRVRSRFPYLPDVFGVDPADRDDGRRAMTSDQLDEFKAPGSPASGLVLRASKTGPTPR